MAFTIKELESLSGIKAHTIRIWEQRYNFLKPGRSSTNIRMYNNEELKTLLTVALLNKYGFKISRIDEMPPEQRNTAILNLQQAEAQEEYLINQLIGCMIDLKQQEFEEGLNRHIQANGIYTTIHSLIFRFLEKVGLLWQANKVNPAQEHIVSNIIRQKLISAIDELPVTPEREPLYLLFLPEYEHHELGLLFVYYLLKRKKVPVLYLGANVPLKDVQFVIKLKRPAAVYTHLVSFPRQLHFEKFLHQLSAHTTDSIVVVSGSITTLYHKPLPGNTIFLKSFSESISYINSI